MKNCKIFVGRFLSFALLVIFTLGLLMPYAGYGETAKQKIYDPALNVKEAIKTALQKCEKENKHMLLIFGGNWCPWCHRLHHLLKTDTALATFLKENYILIMVDVGEKPNEPLNRDLVDLYRVKGMGYPSLAVLGKKGELLCSQSSGILEKGKGHDPVRVMGFMKANAPAKKAH